MRIALRVAAAGAAIAALTGAANASPARVETDLNLRAGPSTGYSVVAVLPDGAVVDVQGCSGSWCQVEWQGYEGYASASYLSGYGGGGGAAVVVGPPSGAFQIGIYAGAPYYYYNGRYFHRGRWYDNRPRWVRRDFNPRNYRREANQDRREFRRETSQDRRDFRRETNQDRREFRRETRQDRRDFRRDASRDNQRQLRNRSAQQNRVIQRQGGNARDFGRGGGGGGGNREGTAQRLRDQGFRVRN